MKMHQKISKVTRGSLSLIASFALIIAIAPVLGGCRSTKSVVLDTPALKIVRTDREDFDIMFSRWNTLTTFDIFLNGKKLVQDDYRRMFFGRQADDAVPAVPGYYPSDVIVLDSSSILLRVKYSGSMADDAGIFRMVMDGRRPRVETLATGIPAEMGFFDGHGENWVGMHANDNHFLLVQKRPYKVHSLPGTYLAQISDRTAITFNEEMDRQGNEPAYTLRAVDIETGRQVADYAFDDDRYYPQVRPKTGQEWFTDNFRFESSPVPTIQLRPDHTLEPRPRPDGTSEL